MMFSSGKNSTVTETIDPEDAPEGARFFPGMNRTYFIDWGLTNPANEILAAVRESLDVWRYPTGPDDHDSDGDDPYWTWYEWVRTGNQEVSWIPEEVMHARRVLARLVNLQNLVRSPNGVDHLLVNDRTQCATCGNIRGHDEWKD